MIPISIRSSDRDLLVYLIEQQENMMSDLSDIKDDLAATKKDLADINTAVTTTVPGMQTKIADLTAKISTLEAGKVLTDTEIAGMVKTADDLRLDAAAVLAVVKPPNP